MDSERRISNRNTLDKFAIDFCRVIEKHCKYIIVSGFVAIASGRVRATEDIDMIIEKVSKDKFIEIFNDLNKNGFECMQSSKVEDIDNSVDWITQNRIVYHGNSGQMNDTITRIHDIFDYLIRGDNIRYTRKENNLFPPEMDIHFAEDELDEWQLREREKIDFTGLNLWFSSIEFNIAFKEELLKDNKDIEDARHLRSIYSGKFSEEKINKIKNMIKSLRLKE